MRLAQLDPGPPHEKHSTRQLSRTEDAQPLQWQDITYQREAAERLHLPFSILSDAPIRYLKAVADHGKLLPRQRAALPIDSGGVPSRGP